MNLLAQEMGAFIIKKIIMNNILLIESIESIEINYWLK